MKKTILAVSMTALFATSVSAVEILKTDVADVDFYGQLRTQLEFKKDKDATLNAGSSRTGVNASYVAAENIKVFGGVEFGLSGNGGALENRLHFAGVDTDYGKLTFGNQYIVADDVWGADYSYFFGGSAVALAEEISYKHSSLIKYNGEFAGVWLAASLSLAEDDTNTELAELFVGTSFGDLSVHLGGGVEKDNTTTDAVTADKTNTYAEVTAEYAFGAALIGVQYYYSELEVGTTSTDRDGFSIAGTYDVNEQLGLYAGFELVDNGTDDVDTTYLGSAYQINDFSKVYAEYGLVDSDNNFALGYRVYW